MKKKIILTSAALVVAVIYSGCKKDNHETQPAPSSYQDYRKILLEDYTGHRGGTCATAAALIYGTGGLKSIYGDTLISIAVHASLGSTFTETSPPASYPQGAPVGSFSVDYRTPAGENWLAFFGINTCPMGMVSRMDYPSSQHQKLPSNWGTAVQSIVHTPAQVRIQIFNTYNSATGNLDINIKSTFLTSVNGTFYLSVLLTEDSLISWQHNYTLPNIPPYYQNDSAYVHRNILRGAINTADGEQLISGLVNSGSFVSKSYSVNLLNLPVAINPLNPTLSIDHCAIVAFVYDDTTKEILQAEMKKVR